MFDSSPQSPDRPLLTTTTGEPYQPVRLSYSVPSKGFVTNVFCRLRCMAEDRDGGRWGWFLRAEAESMTFANPPVKPPVEMDPVLLGVFRFPKSGGMTLQVRSFSRAIEASRFFGPILGPKVVARRARVINRLFDGNELTDGLDALDRHLDRNVTVIDPRETEETMARYMAGAKTAEERRQAYERYHEDQRRERRDVPLVEDFPLAPEEETADFMHLKTTLRLREIRAYEHWIGNTHVILRDVIERLVTQADPDSFKG